MKPRYLISACLCGECTRYDGGCFDLPLFRELAESGAALPFCPECAGGLPTPRPPCEINGERVLTQAGKDCTAEYRRGAQMALALCREHGITAAILKESSPSCGSTRIRDGSHTGRKIPGRGITARLLIQNGVTIYSEENLPPELTEK